MTDATAAADTTTPETAPPGHYYVIIKDHKMLVKEINEAQSMVLGGYLRQMRGTVDFDKITDIFGKLMQLIENLIPSKEDMDWLESEILDGRIEVADFAEIFHSHTTTTKPVAAKKPRRGK